MSPTPDQLYNKAYEEAKKINVTLDSHFSSPGPNFENNYNSDLYKKYIRYKTLDDVLKREQDCQKGNLQNEAGTSICTPENKFFGTALVNDYKAAKADYYNQRASKKLNDSDENTLSSDDIRIIDEKGPWGSAASTEATNISAENVAAMAEWIWNNKKPVINDLIRNIDASIQYYEAQHVYNGRLKGVDDMQKIYNKNIIEEKDKLMDKKNIFSRLSEYNMREENDFNEILPWLRLGYWILFGIIIFFLFKSNLWKNVKVYAFLLALLLIPALLPAITTHLNKELHNSKLKSIYIGYIILGIILVYGLYFTGNLPFVSDIQSSSGNLSPGNIDLPKPSMPPIPPPPSMPKPPMPPVSPPKPM